MVQLHHDYQTFKDLNTEIMVMVPNGPKMIERYLNEHNIPYPILSDKGSKVAGQYLQVKRLFSLGTPTVLLVERTGKISYAHYARSLIEEPDNSEPIKVLAENKGRYMTAD